MFRVELQVNHIHVTNVLMTLDGILFSCNIKKEVSAVLLCVSFNLMSRKNLLSFHSIKSVKSEHREERLPLSSVVLYSSTEINPPQAQAVELFLYTALTVR